MQDDGLQTQRNAGLLTATLKQRHLKPLFNDHRETFGYMGERKDVTDPYAQKFIFYKEAIIQPPSY